DLDMMVVQLLQNRVAVASPGYSGEGRLDHVNAIKSVNTNAVTLRVTSASMPGYLRGKAFDTFDGRRWASLADAVVVHPAANDSGPDGAARWFPLANGDADLSSGEMTVQRAASLHGAVFTRLESAQVSADLDELTVDAHRIVVAGQLEPGAPYTVKGDVSAGHAPDAAERAAMTDVPRDIDPRIRTVADEISRNCTRDEERVAAVVGYLHATCTYSLDPKRGTSDDPMTVFLFENRAGHCELFATAASLLLRCMGVPCRYVTGFVAIEQNAYGGYWTARNRDAHAWVEAYLAGSGWTTVEATPAAGLPHEEASRFAQMWDYVVHRAKSAAAAIRNMDARALAVAAGLWIVRSLPVLAPIAAAIVTWVLLRRWSARRRRAPELDDGPDTVALNRRLHAMDRATARRGLVRAANETIDRFADRIESATHTDIATWYRTYSKARYGGDAPAIRAVLERTANSPR
ncbi:MAG: transglutaminase domain-containing protein, partial [Candidatus Hydrogenedentes bacterium]|nr:transglutaminase domain-containing protein [Candidatus Hydrogenedentota bacterium]